MRKRFAVVLTLTLTMGLCACGGATPPSNTAAPASTAKPEETAAAPENKTAEAEEVTVTLPEDKDMSGVFKWVEIKEHGVDAYLILWDDGVGSMDFVGTGTVRGVFYDDETMKVADEGAVPQRYAYADDKLTWTYTDEQGEHISTFVRLTAEERAAYQALGVGSVVETPAEESKEKFSPWPEDNGGIAGVYKWVEMADKGIDANLILFDDGIGVFDMLGVVESVKYDKDTMQSSGEGALPQSYTYADGTLTWVAKDKSGEQVSTFVKLTPEELAEYEARGIGKGK